jgi:hypothetical protein
MLLIAERKKIFFDLIYQILVTFPTKWYFIVLDLLAYCNYYYDDDDDDHDDDDDVHDDSDFGNNKQNIVHRRT